MAVFRCRAALQLVGLIALMAATVPSDSAAPSGSVRSSKMKPPPIIPEESSNKNRRSSGKSLAFSSRCFFLSLRQFGDMATHLSADHRKDWPATPSAAAVARLLIEPQSRDNRATCYLILYLVNEMVRQTNKQKKNN